jgi:hypothetical protein
MGMRLHTQSERGRSDWIASGLDSAWRGPAE